MDVSRVLRQLYVGSYPISTEDIDQLVKQRNAEMAGGSFKQKGKRFGFIEMGGKGLFFYAAGVHAVDFSRLHEGQKVVLHGGGPERLGCREHHADIAGCGVSA